MMKRKICILVVHVVHIAKEKKNLQGYSLVSLGELVFIISSLKVSGFVNNGLGYVDRAQDQNLIQYIGVVLMGGVVVVWHLGSLVLLLLFAR